MCGRFAITLPHEAMVQLFEAVPANDLPPVPNWNVCPTDPVSVVTAREGIMRDGGRRLVAMRWGLVPPRYETPAGGPLLVNTRADTIAEKPALRAAVRERRRLIPASGVIQMDSDGRKGAAAPVRHAKRRAAADLAEIWQDWERDGQRLTTCAIVTCDAEGPMGRIHHRMPVQRGWS